MPWLRSHSTTFVVQVVIDRWNMNAWPVSVRMNWETPHFGQVSCHADSSSSFARPGMIAS